MPILAAVALAGALAAGALGPGCSLLGGCGMEPGGACCPAPSQAQGSSACPGGGAAQGLAAGRCASSQAQMPAVAGGRRELAPPQPAASSLPAAWLLAESAAAGRAAPAPSSRLPAPPGDLPILHASLLI